MAIEVHSGNILLAEPFMLDPNFKRSVVVGGQSLNLVGLRLCMVGDGDTVQTLAPRLLNSHRGPDQAIREDRVHVEVALECPVAGNVRNAAVSCC